MSIAWRWAGRTIRTLSMTAQKWAIHDFFNQHGTHEESNFPGRKTRLFNDNYSQEADDLLSVPELGLNDPVDFLNEWHFAEFCPPTVETRDISEFLANTDWGQLRDHFSF